MYVLKIWTCLFVYHTLLTNHKIVTKIITKGFQEWEHMLENISNEFSKIKKLAQ